MRWGFPLGFHMITLKEKVKTEFSSRDASEILNLFCFFSIWVFFHDNFNNRHKYLEWMEELEAATGGVL